MKSAAFLVAACLLVLAGEAPAQGRRDNINIAVNGNGASAIVQKSNRGLFGRRQNLNIVVNGGNGAAQVRDRRNNLLLVQNGAPRSNNVLLLRDGGHHHFNNNAAAIIAAARVTSPARIVAVRDYSLAQQQFLLRLEDGSLCN